MTFGSEVGWLGTKTLDLFVTTWATTLGRVSFFWPNVRPASGLAHSRAPPHPTAPEPVARSRPARVYSFITMEDGLFSPTIPAFWHFGT